MKSLIIYFSRADENYFGGSLKYIEKGNTEVVADYLQELTNADIFKVEPLVPYSKDYNTCINEAKERVHNAPIKNTLNDISEFNTIYVLSPIYWGTYAPEMETALKNLDFNGKKVVPISTHEGSGLGNIPNDLRNICTGALVTEGLAIRGSESHNSKEMLQEFIAKIS